MKKNILITGTLLLTFTGLISRVIGFFYRIYLSRMIGEEGMGIYQLLAPVMALTFSLTAAGIQTSISKHTAAYFAKKEPLSSFSILLCGLVLSVSLSILTGLFLFKYSSIIATKYLLEPRCSSFIQIYALSIPFAAVHSCINGYYYGLKKTLFPSITQLAEQFIRVISVFLLFDFFQNRDLKFSISIVITGLVLGEIVSCIISFVALIFESGKYKRCFQAQIKGGASNLSNSILNSLKPLLLLACPLSLNRITLNFLQSCEAVYLPEKMCSFGLSTSEALSTYGVLTGMALPMILFPQALTGSISVLLLPYVSEAQAQQNKKQISKAIGKCTSFCLLLGFCALTFFYLSAPLIGTHVFHSDESGLFIRALSFLCPFLYLSTILTSILNGLGKAVHAFFINVLAVIIRLFSVFFLVPYYGIRAYLIAMLISQIIHCLCNFLALRTYLYYNKNVFSQRNKDDKLVRKRK